MRSTVGNELSIGHLPGRSAALTLPRSGRDKHLYICGTTGKSKLLESLVRQDIISWRKSRCGMLVLEKSNNLLGFLKELELSPDSIKDFFPCGVK